jgi:glucosamine 6-phosphate synthetase-like amidotransferase/phosphosugar isomerase protein
LFRQKLIEKIREARWTVTNKESTPFPHHMLFEVHHVTEGAGSDSTMAAQMQELQQCAGNIEKLMDQMQSIGGSK